MGRNNIMELDKKAQDAMRKVCRLGREVLDIAAREVKPGVTTDHIDQVVHNACIERNVGPSQGCVVDSLTMPSPTLRPSTTSTSPSRFAHHLTK